ncbi:MAG: hypothetical protein ACLFPO_07285 [Spirochaetaceae bacterium]
MDWIQEALEHVHGVDELRSVADKFLKADRATQREALQKLWQFIGTLDEEEKTKFTVMAVILETAADALHERLHD